MIFILLLFLPFLSCFEIEEPEFFEIKLDRDHPEKIYKEFEDFKIRFHKNYKTPEENALRLKNYLKKSKKVNALNQKAEEQGHNTKFGINSFSDLSASEFQQRLSHHRPNSSEPSKLRKLSSKNIKSSRAKRQTGYDVLPETFDLREIQIKGKDIIGPVKDQQGCGCCWGFAVVGVVETVNVVNSGRFRSLSEQELCDCATDGSLGCNGGSIVHGAEYVMGKGLATDIEYEYDQHRANQTGMCIADKMKRAFPPNRLDFVEIDHHDAEHQIKGVLYHWNTPVAVYFACSHSFENYQSGVLEMEDCELDGTHWHAGVVVGYGEDRDRHGAPRKYWIMKNSWGADDKQWGQGGYIKMSRGVNWCGIEEHAVGGNLHGLIEHG